MKWRDKLLAILSAASPVALVWAADDANAAQGYETGPAMGEDIGVVFRDPASERALLQLAGHRSHSSHSSHSSHRSHYSSSGGTYSPPSVYTPAAPVAPATPPATFTSPSGSYDATKLSKTQLSEMIQQVQLALIVKGYDPGPVDGVLSTQTKSAIKAFQQSNSLKATGLMDRQTLLLLGVL